MAIEGMEKEPITDEEALAYHREGKPGKVEHRGREAGILEVDEPEPAVLLQDVRGEEVVVAAEILGGRMEDEVDARFDRAEVIGSGQRGVDDDARIGGGTRRVSDSTDSTEARPRRARARHGSRPVSRVRHRGRGGRLRARRQQARRDRDVG